jgi:hypothetical protein
MWGHIGRREWVEDALAPACFACGGDFSLFRRRHHCRCCGRVHCYACCSHFHRVPPVLHQLSQDTSGGVVRLCDLCYENSAFAQCHEALLVALAGMPLSMVALHGAVRVVCSRWKGAVDAIDAVCRPLHVELVIAPCTRLQTVLLRAHRGELARTLRWRVHILRAGWAPARNTLLTCPEILSLRSHQHLPHVRAAICQTWKALHNDVNLVMLPHWLDFARQDKAYFDHGVLALAQRCKGIAMRVYLRTKNLRVLCAVSHQWKLDILKAVAFVDSVACLSSAENLDEARAMLRAVQKPFLLPWSPHVECLNIDTSTLCVIPSACKPLRVTLDVRDAGKAYRCDILIKRDNLTQDCVAMAVAFWMNRLCRTDITRYSVFKINDQVGIIAMLTKAVSLYSLKYVKRQTLLNHLLELNPDKSALRLRGDFVASSADAAMFAYCVGVGDRHLQNMLVDDVGNPVHIDFGFLFGEDPKGRTGPIRLTQDTVDALGGAGSPSFQIFVKRCQAIYVRMRKHVRFWFQLASHHEGALVHFQTRFLRGELDARASVRIAVMVDVASAPCRVQSLLDAGRHILTTLHR